jgi:hypothetical protein
MAAKKRKTDSECVTEATELGHRVGRRRAKDRKGGPAAPRAACSVKLGLGLGELCEKIG